MNLTPQQTRVLGSLVEKEIATPEYYPLSLNALINACNQKSSREPVMELSEEEVREALRELDDLGYTSSLHDGRVPKYEHRIRTVLNLRRDETAILCLLLLRGPQTPGELRGRADRLYAFDDIPAVQSTLNRMAEREVPLVAVAPRLAGAARYTHLLSGLPEISTTVAAPVETAPRIDRIAQLEERIAGLEHRLASLEAAWATRRPPTPPLPKAFPR